MPVESVGNVMNNGQFSGKVVLVCGAGLEIGRDISHQLALDGASLALQDYTPVNLDETIKAVRETGAKAEEYIFDISKKISAQVMMSQIKDRFGQIDFLINIPVVRPLNPILEMDEWDWQRTVEMNVNASFLMIQLAAREMGESGGGAIINLIGKSGDCGFVSSAYAASMAAVVGLGDAAAIELVRHRVRLFTAETDHYLGYSQKSAGEGSFQVDTARSGSAKNALEKIAAWIQFLCIHAADLPVGLCVNTDWGIPQSVFFRISNE